VSLAGFQTNLINVKFHLQKFGTFLVKIQLTKSDQGQRDKNISTNAIRVNVMTAMPAWHLCQHGSYTSMAATPAWQLRQHGNYAFIGVQQQK
jgi:hypothetical protein